jgi:EAL domain-containing protein (putative c-di-GMP-specific phosphodiesterase class I)
VKGALAAAQFDARRFQIEVTETALLSDFARAKANLMELRATGVTMVLDDFGAGYASIAYLRQLTFDQIKLDGSLVAGAQESADGKRLLAAVIGLCQELGVSTVAEHIENEDQKRIVAELGCAAGQGFWLQAPLSPQAALELACGRSATGPTAFASAGPEGNVWSGLMTDTGIATP